MRLNHLANKILLSDTKKLVATERSALTKLLHHLKEIDKRRLYCDLKYSSLFAYCVHELGYSEGAAQRRIVAARALAEMPEIEQKIENGRLNLTNISLVNQFIEDPIERRQVLVEVENLTKKECEQKLFEITGKEEKVKDKQQRISKDKIQVAFVLTDETMAQVEKLKALLGKDFDMDQLVQFMAKEAIKSMEKKKFKQTSLSPAKVGKIKPSTTHKFNHEHRGPSTKENLRMLGVQWNQTGKMRAGLRAPPPE